MAKPKTPATPDGYNTVNPFIISDKAETVIAFVKDVFDGIESPDALTRDEDGLILHSEVKLGDSVIMIADRKPDWPYTPSLLQVYVDDVQIALKKAQSHGAAIVTKPTDFMGTLFARVKDAQGNLWWIYQYIGEVDWSEAAEGDDQSWEPSKEAVYIHDTLLEAMRGLKK
ncbi:MAG TPA: VOC family protein [Candidatus Saccharimonadales bacterium]|nr:VOC family protein [Candidatus Saccharimonadales bacterium]